MSRVTAFEAKNRLGRLLQRVSGGEEIIITRHGEPVAKLVPIQGSETDGVGAVETIAGLREQLARKKVRVSRREAKSWIRTGRR